MVYHDQSNNLSSDFHKCIIREFKTYFTLKQFYTALLYYRCILREGKELNELFTNNAPVFENSTSKNEIKNSLFKLSDWRNSS